MADDTVEWTDADVDELRAKLTDYRDHILTVDDGLPADYEDGYIDGLDYALKILGGEDARSV